LRHETNPRNESFENCVTKRIHETNLLKTRGFANPNPKDSDGFVYPIVLRIREDLLDSSNLLKIASRNKSFENGWIRGPRFETNLSKSGFVTHDTNRIFLSLDLWPTNWYKSMVAKRIHVFTNLLYDSCIVSYDTRFNFNAIMRKFDNIFSRRLNIWRSSFYIAMSDRNCLGELRVPKKKFDWNKFCWEKSKAWHLARKFSMFWLQEMAFTQMQVVWLIEQNMTFHECKLG
jgi:hypothetical protein